MPEPKPIRRVAPALIAGGVALMALSQFLPRFVPDLPDLLPTLLLALGGLEAAIGAILIAKFPNR